MPAWERKFTDRRTGSSATPPSCRRPGAEELADLGLAEAVDRLHRVADREQRPPVAGRPAGGELLDQLVLGERRVLELVDQHVPHAIIERERDIGRRVVLPSARSAACATSTKSTRPSAAKTSRSVAIAC